MKITVVLDEAPDAPAKVLGVLTGVGAADGVSTLRTLGAEVPDELAKDVQEAHNRVVSHLTRTGRLDPLDLAIE